MESYQFFIILVVSVMLLLFLRVFLYRLLVKSIQKQLFYKDYVRILNAPEFKVKGKFEQ